MYNKILLIINIFILCMIITATTVYAGYVDDGWTYRGYVDLPDPDTTLTDYIALVTSDMLDADILDYSYGWGADLRFATDPAGSSPCAFMFINPGDPLSQIKTKIASVTTSTRLYYFVGNPDADFLAHDATYGSDNVYPTTWDMVYDFDNNVKLPTLAVDGYCVPVVSLIQWAPAVYYNGKTYIVWQGSGAGDIYIKTYTHSTSTWSSAVKVFTNPLTSDAHGYPVVMIDGSGYIHVMGGVHKSAILHYKSDSAEDISAWTAQATFGTSGTYPHIITTNNTIFNAWREGNGTYSSVWSTLASNFQTETDLISAPSTASNIYLGALDYDGTNDYVWFAWVYHYDLAYTGKYNVYVAYMDMSDNNIYSYDGDDLGASISESEANTNCKVVSDTTYAVSIPLLVLDNNERPHIIYNHDNATTTNICHQYWNGTAWSGETVVGESRHADNGPGGYYTDGKLQIYFAYNSAGNATGDLQHWEYDGTWSFIRTVIKSANMELFADGACAPSAVYNGVDSLRLIFAGGDFDDLTNSDLPVMAIDNHDNFVYSAMTARGYTNVYDRTLNDKDGTVTGAAIHTGKIGNSVYFDGNDRILLESNILDSTASHSIIGWYKVASTTAANYMIPYSFLDGWGLQMQCFGSGHGSFPLEIGPYVINTTSTGYPNNVEYAYGTWLHVAGVVSSGEFSVYKDGELSNTISSIGTIKTYTSTSYLGTDGSYPYNGDIDEFYVIHEALSDDYIEMLYDNQNDPENFPTSTQDLVPVGIVPMIQPVIIY